MRKLLITMVALLGIVGLSFAQSGAKLTVSGMVTDKANEPLIGVSVTIKNNPGIGVRTNIDGEFSIKAKQGEYLVFSYLGKATQEYQVTKAASKVKITLKDDDKQLEEIVVTGTGVQSKISVIGAISSIDTKELQTPSTSINNMMAGRIPGIVSVQTSGEPGKNVSEFWVRGIGTFGANSGALVLIDGLEGDLSLIDPADVENFSVLKDASATAIYGVRGANGVVLVTTKRGKAGKLSISVRSNFTVSQLKRLPKYADAYTYATLANEARAMSGDDPVYGDLAMTLLKENLDPDLYPNVNWQEEILNPVSLQQSYYVNASGGGSIARYFVSVGYNNESAAYRQSETSKYKNGVGYQKFTYRSNTDIDLTPTTKVYMGTDGYVTMQNTPGGINTDQLWAMTRNLTPLTFPTQYSTGQFPTYGPYDIYSPYTMLNETGYKNHTKNRNLVTLSITQDLSMITKGLNAKLQVSSDHTTDLTEERRLAPPMYKATGRFSDGTLQLAPTRNRVDVIYSRNLEQWRKYVLEANVSWNRTFDEHTLSSLVRYKMEDSHDTSQTPTIGGGSSSIANVPFRYQELAGRVNYSFRNTYFVDANFGYTGSANFPTGHQFGFFPSIAVGWIPTEYEFMKENLSWLSFLKLRYSYGMVGNDKITSTRFPYLTLVSQGNTYWGYTGYGIEKTQVGASNLRWETAIKQNIGIESKFFKDAFTFNIDFFQDRRDNIFQQRTTIPDYVGLINMPFSNVGSMYSYGTDGNLEYFGKINKDMDFTLRGNFTYSANYTSHYEEAIQPYPYLNATGYPWGVQRGLVSLGLFKDQTDVETSPKQTFGVYRPGDIKYKDVNNDGVINDNDRVPLSYSDGVPRLTYGFGGSFRYKNLSVSVLFRGTGAVQYYRAGNGYDAGWIPFISGDLGNVLEIVSDQNNRWTAASYSGNKATENPNAVFPRLSYGKNENNSQLSTFWQEDGSFIRFQELNIGYKFSGYKWFNSLGISSIQTQLVCNNLFTIDKVKYFDPEQAKYNGGKYPIPARYTLQLYVNF